MKEYNPELYYNLELNIMSCLLQRPELMKQCTLEDKYFVKFHRLWKFMKAFYSKYKTFDIPIMVSISTNRKELVEFLGWIVEIEPAPSRFETYQKQLVELYEESQREKVIIEKLVDLANQLYVRNISLSEYKKKVNDLIGGEISG